VLARESVSAEGLHARLRQLGAEYYPDRSAADSHIYYARPLRRWLRVARQGDVLVIEHHRDCPCG
jgi:hypothetical protein